MIKVTMYKTSDGQAHESWDAAKKHAEERYGALVCELARGICNVTKYEAATKFVETYATSFARLVELKEDMKLTSNEEDTDGD